MESGIFLIMGRRNSWLFISAFILLFGCKKAEDRTCWKSSGSVTEREFQLADFQELEVNEQLHVNVIPDTISSVKIRCGSNLINMVEADVVNGKLILKSKNKCRFLRYKSDRITIEVRAKKLTAIYFHGSDSLVFKDTMLVDDFNLQLNEGAGSVKLLLKGNRINVENSVGWGDVTLSGSANFFRAKLEGNGYFDSRNLLVNDSISLISKSAIVSRVNATNCVLKAQLFAKGDIFYYGQPLSIKKIELGEGNLVYKE
ncbi:MAG: hypothetical protein RL264_2504 [Bacteroidota bacterium]